MLKICEDTLPQTPLAYVAFRAAFRDTLERIVLWRRFEKHTHDLHGFLAEVPFLREVPPAVQLDVLATTWQRHFINHQIEADLIDESVIYAVCETAAQLSEQEPALLGSYLSNGPLPIAIPVDGGLAERFRKIYLDLSNEGDFLLISQFLDMPPDQAESLKRDLALNVGGCEMLFDLLGRWNVETDFPKRLRGLLTDAEIVSVTRELGLSRSLV